MSNLPPPPPPQYGAPPPSPGKVRLRGRIPLRLALILGVVGIVLISIGAVVLAKGSLAKVNDFDRVALDGATHSVRLTRTGAYVGYYEDPGLNTSRRVPAGKLAITGPRGDVAFRSYDSSTLRYDINGHHGVAVVKFSIASAGTYTFSGSPATPKTGAQLAIGESIAGSLVAGVLLVLPGVLLVIAAIVLLIVGLVKRGRHKRERQANFDAYRGP